MHGAMQTHRDPAPASRAVARATSGAASAATGPTPLTAQGRAQAEATARALAAEGGLTAIFASDLVRARCRPREPIVAGDAASPMRTTPALRERSVGVFTGLTFAEAEAALSRGLSPR